MSAASFIKQTGYIFCIYILSTQLAISETLLSIKDHVFTVELAISEQERHLGLMQRQTLADNHGMLFVYSEPRHLSFWMKDTLIALDLIFFDRDGGFLELIENALPCQNNPCPRYTNSLPAQYVLELPAGSVKQLDLNVGDSFEIIDPK